MSPSELGSLLRRVLGRSVAPVDETRRDAELDALAAAHARKYADPAPPPRRAAHPRRAVKKWSLAAGLVAAAAVGACVVPVDYEAEMGQRLVFVVSAQELAELDIESIAR
ncbi:MAG TPA: hypothetical protein VFG69_15680, partial [Nannocystaceae bacterium]|nr:hypothetical protein [Nannocystaceae bacterium]